MAQSEPRKKVTQKPRRQSDTPQNASPKNGASRNAATRYMGTWPKGFKAPAVTKVVHDSISATNSLISNSTSSSAPSLRLSRSQSIDLMRKGKVSTRSTPADPATSRINITSGGSSVTSNDTTLTPNVDVERVHNKNELPKALNEVNPTETPGEQERPVEGDTNGKQYVSQPDTVDGSSGWLAWLYRGGHGADTSSSKNLMDESAGQPVAEPEHESESAQCKIPEPIIQPTADSEQVVADDGPSKTPPRRSWLSIWSENTPASRQSKQETEASSQIDASSVAQGPLNQSDDIPKKNEAIPSAADVPNSATIDSAAELAKETPRSTSWLFWSREKQAMETEGPNPQAKLAELPDLVNQKISQPPSDKPKSSPNSGTLKTKPITALKLDSEGLAKGIGSDLGTEPLPEASKQTPSQMKKVKAPTNQLLPSFENTFPPQERPGIIQQLGRLVYYGRAAEPKHATRLQDRPNIKKALAIGIHGYFPAPLIRNIIGQPTGTSIKFATMTEAAILQWAANQTSPCQVEKIILEGEGRISERVELLWKLLLNWIDHVRSADFIMVSCHSQGVPVATMLVAKLIAFGCISHSTKVGICAMAGVNLGPFPDYRSRWISGSAGELFDFADSKSKVSQEYMAALQTALDFGVRIAYIGSIDDQLVSLESSVFATISHPHICRAVFVDGRVHAPSFVSHLVGFAMKLRNLGISDHGLIRELSSPLAGSLYTGDGHSRLYDDDAVYQLAIRFTLETSCSSIAGLEVHDKHRISSPSNPYILPFAMRGVLEEDYVRRQLSQETAELLKQFDEWKPTTKVLKDVKFRLEGIRSKL